MSPYVDRLPNDLRNFIVKRYSELTKECPLALYFGVEYVEYLLELIDNEGMLAFGVALSILDINRSNENFEFEILRRHGGVDVTNPSHELRGYVDTTLLLVATFIAFGILRGGRYDRNVHEQMVFARLKDTSQFDNLPPQVQDSSWKSVSQNLGYIIDKFRLEDQDDLDHLIKIIVAKLKSGSSNGFYARGVDTAECTFKVYHELLSELRSG